MANRDFRSHVKAVEALRPAAARTATVTGVTVDTAGYQGVAFIVYAGTVTDGTHTLSLQHSDTDSAYAACAAADLQGSFTALTSATTAGAITRVGYIGSKRYVQLVSTVTGSPGTGGVYDAVALLGFPMHGPA